MRREALGLSRAQLAASLGMPADDLEAVEDGRRRAGTEALYGLARLLDVKVAFFFDHAVAAGAAGYSARTEGPSLGPQTPIG